MIWKGFAQKIQSHISPSWKHLFAFLFPCHLEQDLALVEWSCFFLHSSWQEVGRKCNARWPVPPQHVARHLHSSIKTRTIFMVLTKWYGWAVRWWLIHAASSVSCLQDSWQVWRSCFFLFPSFPFLSFLFSFLFFVTLLPDFHSLLFSK